MGFVVTPASVVRSEALRPGDVAVLTFNAPVVESLRDLCAARPVAWIDRFAHPYAAPELVLRGIRGGLGIAVIVPPMGASPLSCVVEDLAACGVAAVFLVCAAWSLGPPVRFGDLIVPSFCVGTDGTSIHYGNTAGRVEADPRGVDALAAAGRARRARVHVGGNGTCEALYRIDRAMVERFREQGCVCMENGEAGTLFAIAPLVGVAVGALFQPYIDLSQGWDPTRLGALYEATCRVQAAVALDAAVELMRRGRFGVPSRA